MKIWFTYGEGSDFVVVVSKSQRHSLFPELGKQYIVFSCFFFYLSFFVQDKKAWKWEVSNELGSPKWHYVKKDKKSEVSSGQVKQKYKL